MLRDPDPEGAVAAGKTGNRVRNALLLVVDLGAGLLLAGAVAPLVLVLLPPRFRGRVFLLVTSVACVAVASALRRRAMHR